ncbi:MAG: hypothetical protein BWY88_00317 [Synergistetes bacterium ADurb.Bin520]|nr:MAG: hypothetical protein BWY88_00317 [Synergistetes bacterium ADurb.Bin520]
MVEVSQRRAPRHPVGKGNHHVAILEQRFDADAFFGAAVLFGDNKVLGHVHQAAREVSGLGRTKGRVRQSLASSVGRDEVLQHVQPLAEVGHDGVVDDAPRGVRHESPDARHLGHLALGTPGPRIHHHAEVVVLGHVLNYALRHFPAGIRPQELLLTEILFLCQDTHLVLRGYFSLLHHGGVHHFFLLGRYHHVVQAETHAAPRRPGISQGLDGVQGRHELDGGNLIEGVIQEFGQGLLVHRLIDKP